MTDMAEPEVTVTVTPDAEAAPDPAPAPVVVVGDGESAAAEAGNALAFAAEVRRIAREESLRAIEEDRVMRGNPAEVAASVAEAVAVEVVTDAIEEVAEAVAEVEPPPHDEPPAPVHPYFRKINWRNNK